MYEKETINHRIDWDKVNISSLLTPIANRIAMTTSVLQKMGKIRVLDNAIKGIKYAGDAGMYQLRKDMEKQKNELYKGMHERIEKALITELRKEIEHILWKKVREK